MTVLDPTWLFTAGGVALLVLGSWWLVKRDGPAPSDRKDLRR